MPRKSLQIQVELDIQAVTCPGVWLCPNGKVSLQISMLDSFIQTTGLRPLFPFLFHEKFVFYKTFHKARSLGDLQQLLNKDYLYAELIQWQNCDTGNVLASFQTCLSDVLYPSSYEGTISGVDIDLLMDPSKNYPGIIAPKIEISTRTTIEEVVCSNNYNKKSYVVNPKLVTSNRSPYTQKPTQPRQQKVCHSLNYHKSRKCTRMKRSNRPPFVFRKAEEELIARKPQSLPDGGKTKRCKCCLRSRSTSPEKSYSKLTDSVSRRYSKSTKKTKDKDKKAPQICSCRRAHVQEFCPLCARYQKYFKEGNPYTCSGTNRNTYVHKVTTSSPTRESVRGAPLRTLGKEWHPCNGTKFIATSQTISPREVRTRDYSPAFNEDHSVRKVCYCSEYHKKPSMAEQIHQRLKETLDCSPSYVYGNDDQDSYSTVDCGCPTFQDCKEGFYRNLGKFYRNLHRC